MVCRLSGTWVLGLCTTNGNYTGDFKASVVEYMSSTGSSARQTAAHFNIPSYTTVCNRERIWLEEGMSDLYEERRGIANHMSGVKKDKKLIKEKQKDEDLIAEVQRLRTVFTTKLWKFLWITEIRTFIFTWFWICWAVQERADKIYRLLQ